METDQRLPTRFIDCHVHGDPEVAEAPRCVEEYQRRGADAVVLIEPLRRCLAAIERLGDFVIPIAWIDMDSATTREIEECLDRGCRGIKFIDPDAPYGDERYWPLYEALQERGRTAVFHTGYFAPEFSAKPTPSRIEYMRAAQVDVVARHCPRLKILMAHFSNPWWEEGWKIAWSNPNVYADLSGGTAIHRSMSMWAEMFAPDGVVHEESICKLCFGTDVTCFDEGDYPFDEYLARYELLFDRIGVPPSLRERVLRLNALELFGAHGTH
jgi:predicted TIM-barrel fold metal-dependent hydrolase